MSLIGSRGNQILKLLVRQRIRADYSRSLTTICQNPIYSVIHTKNSKKCILQLCTVGELSAKWEVLGYKFYSDYPSHKKVPLPALSPTMERGSLISWAKKEGDKLNEGDLLAEIETDKATMGFETPDEGFLAKILIPAGTRDIPVGKLVCIIVENKEDVGKFKDFKDDSLAVASSTPASPPKPSVGVPPAATAPSVAHEAIPLTEKGRIYASPMAKNLAMKKGIKLENVAKGTGLYDSITVKDLDSVKQSPAAPKGKQATAPAANFTDIPVSNIRSVIARRLLESKQTIPHYYLTMDVRVDELLKLRTILNRDLEKQKIKISVNDFIIKATALSSKRVPEANSHWMDTFIRQHHAVDVSVAVSTDRGLITPIVFNADSKGLMEISQNVKVLAAKAKDGKLQPHEFQGGTISVSNLGMFGTTHFCAIINPPQSTILAVGTTQDRMVPVDGVGEPMKFITVTLSCDHRVVDGALGAQWLKVFKELIETPHKMLL